MKPFKKRLWIALGINLGAVLLTIATVALAGEIAIPLILVTLLGLVCEFFIGLLLVFIPANRETGQILLISSSIFLLIGLSICSGVWT